MVAALPSLVEMAAVQTGLAASIRVPGSPPKQKDSSGPANIGGLSSDRDTALAQRDAHEQDTARDRSAAQTRVHERDCKCPPEKGAPVIRNWNMSAISQAYQDYVTGVYIAGAEPMPPGTEWSFAGRDFDGFRSMNCQLEEAKAKYDQFFKAPPPPKKAFIPKKFFALFGAKKIINQAVAQNAIVLANPPAKLQWYFMQPKSYQYFTRQFMTAAPLAKTVFKPLASESQD